MNAAARCAKAASLSSASVTWHSKPYSSMNLMLQRAFTWPSSFLVGGFRYGVQGSMCSGGSLLIRQLNSRALRKLDWQEKCVGQESGNDEKRSVY